MGFDWKKSKAHLLLLSKFVHAQRPDDFAKSDDWKNVLSEPSKQAIKRFVNEGMLMTADLNDLLSYKYRVNELKDLLKQRGLPVSGRKDELIQRLAQADPDGMGKAVAELSLLKCTQRGHEIAEQYLEAEKEKLAKVELQVMEYLIKRKFREASLAVAAWEKDQVFPLGFTTGIASEKQNPNRDNETSQNRIKMLNIIFESKPKILVCLGHEKLETLRKAAAMMALWGETKTQKWLPADLETGLHFDNNAAVRMFVFYTQHRANLEKYRREGVEYVEVFPAPDSCESCKKLAGKHYKIDEAPELPNPNCTHEMGCRCRFFSLE